MANFAQQTIIKYLFKRIKIQINKNNSQLTAKNNKRQQQKPFAASYINIIITRQQFLETVINRRASGENKQRIHNNKTYDTWINKISNPNNLKFIWPGFWKTPPAIRMRMWRLKNITTKINTRYFKNIPAIKKIKI